MSMCSKGLTLLSAVAAMLIAVTAVRSTALAAPVPLEGVWRTVEVVIPSSAQTFKPGATLAIFHGRHYSRVEVHAEGPRPVLKDPAAASASELRAMWGPFVGEAGTFEVSGNEVDDAGTRGEESRGHDERRDQRLHLPAGRRYADADTSSYARGPESRSRDH